MTHKGYTHAQSLCACITRLSNRILCILKENRKYKLQDVNGREVTSKEAKEIIKERYIVPEEIRKRTRTKNKRMEFNI